MSREFYEKYKGGTIYKCKAGKLTFYDWVHKSYQVDELTTQSVENLKKNVDKFLELYPKK